MLFPSIFCTETGHVCQLTLGEGEINAAASMMALILSNRFDFRQAYFLFAGIAGANPHHATIGSVAIARYAVQVALQYEIDPRSLPQDWPTGYISYGRDYPLQYPSVIYGTEVFEVNDNLRQAAFALASKSRLSDQNGPREYRSKYSGGGYRDAVATRAPSVVRCDIATSDVYYSGTKLAVAFENTTELWTNGSGIYCMSAQEENATLEVMVRAAIEGVVDFARIILLRSGESSNIQYHLSPCGSGRTIRVWMDVECYCRLKLRSTTARAVGLGASKADRSERFLAFHRELIQCRNRNCSWHRFRLELHVPARNRTEKLYRGHLW